MSLEGRQRQKTQLDWRWKKLNRVPMMSKDFDWLEWELLTDDLAEWYCEGLVMQELSARIRKKRQSKREAINGNL